MDILEEVSEIHRGYFVDLYVRYSNAVAVNMYRMLGYVIYRQVIGYYSGEEDAFGTFIRVKRERCGHVVLYVVRCGELGRFCSEAAF